MSTLNRLTQFSSQLCILLIGIILSVMASLYANNHENELARLKFSQHSSDASHSIEDIINRSLHTVQYLSAFYDSTSEVDEKTFSVFAASLIKNHPEIQALEWVPRIPRGKLDEFQILNQERTPGFNVTERSNSGDIISASEREVYFPVQFVVPNIGNDRALGYDIASSASRRNMLEAAFYKETTIASSRLELVQEHEDSYGILVARPVFYKDSHPKSTLMEDESLRGFIVGVYRINKIIELSFLKSTYMPSYIRLTDHSEINDKRLLYLNNHADTKEISDWHSQEQIINTAGRQYVIEIKEPPKRFMDYSWGSTAILVSGLLLTLLLFEYVRIIQQQRRELTTTNNSLQNEISEKSQIERDLKISNKKLESISKEDSLTGIANRRYFDETLQQEWRKGLRSAQPLSIIMIDVDFFKIYNDNYGHVEGDKCLKQVCQEIAFMACRPSDIVARYGGEEIAVILPETPTVGAQRVANNILDHITNLAIPHEHSPAHPYVTVSIGVATLQPAPDFEPNKLIAQADHALYKAKSRGKNCAELFMPDSNRTPLSATTNNEKKTVRLV